MLRVKLLGKKGEFMRTPAVLIRSRKNKIPGSWDFPVELIKTLNVS